jgi:hypothetical protein
MRGFMKQVISEKYSVAWFKIAECVIRGEKERAFGVYRLLAHSLDDDACAQQLAGDIFLSFDDVHAAIQKYTNAAQRYEETQRLLQAAAVYEHLALLDEQPLLHHKKLMELYKALSLPNKVNAHAHTIFEYTIKNSLWDDASWVLCNITDQTIEQSLDRYCVFIEYMKNQINYIRDLDKHAYAIAQLLQQSTNFLIDEYKVRYSRIDNLLSQAIDNHLSQLTDVDSNLNR